jgi:putative FmdB family regulatory protein
MELFEMPIYEYHCTSCNHHFDLMQKINDEPIKQCPVCYAEAVEKLISAAGFQLKGTGWYATDFKNTGGKSKKTSSNNDESIKPEKSDKNSSSKNNQDGDNK